jgi:hypothetical protein
VPRPSDAGRGRWPRSLDEHTAGPKDVAPEWAKHVQGVALTDDWWFITQEHRLWRFPVDGDLAEVDPAGGSVRSVGVPEPGIDHLGDCDYRDGRLYVAMEGSSPARVGVFDTELDYMGSGAVCDQGSSNPWCAIDPLTGRLFSSPFDTDHLVSYELRVDSRGVSLDSSHAVLLRDADGAPLELERVQGGSFSPSGRLYLTVDSRDAAIVGVDVDTGRRMLRHHIERERDGPDYHIVEGLTYGALDRRTEAGMGGQLHVLVFTGAWEQPDYLWFRHYGERY